MTTLNTTRRNTTSAQRLYCDRLNGIIAARNLYYYATEKGNRRAIHAHVADGIVCVKDLYTGKSVPVAGLKMSDGYGQNVEM